MANETIKFVRRKDLRLKGKLGKGACGETVLLHDDVIDELFVCKKYSPYDARLKSALFKKFIDEIKILHLLNHVNIVRVFNYYIYAEDYAGYILMEYVVGCDIENYLSKNPEQINQIFLQVIDGFSHLERSRILHRDIRPGNIMISEEGVVKIIDFGFGKQVIVESDYDKSISLNWWCAPPPDFSQKIYDYATEVYFVGKMFEKIILDNVIEEFSYKRLLGRMCSADRSDRPASFLAINDEILAGKFEDINFNQWEIAAYRDFADQLTKAISQIENSTGYIGDPGVIQRRLEACHKKVMLEEWVPCNTIVLECFLNGAFYFSNRHHVQVSSIGCFIDLLRSCSVEKKNIIIGNLHNRLNSIQRYDEAAEIEDDVPF